MDTLLAVFILTVVRLVVPFGLLIGVGTLINGLKQAKA
jgi:hypothetical protein